MESDETATAQASDESVASETARVQEQILDTIKRTQDAALQIVDAWSESVAKVTSQLPALPQLPLVDALPQPGDLSDQFFAFAQQLMAAQQEFVTKLLSALPGPEKPRT
ncbi:MAG: hypothetical protein ACHQFZ_04370 [Acidimicrobiales bacterium]